MPNYDYLPDQEEALKSWALNFATRCAQYDAELNLTAEDILAINNVTNTFATDLTATQAAKDTYQGTVATKNKSKADLSSVVRAYAKQFKSIQGISPLILNQLGIVGSGSTGPVVQVTDLTVTGCDNGVNSLKWNRSTNADGTIFIVEYRAEGTSTWIFGAAVTKTAFAHTGQIPGEMVWYRVTATRAGINSAPCPAVAAYGNPGAPGISQAA